MQTMNTAMYSETVEQKKVKEKIEDTRKRIEAINEGIEAYENLNHISEDTECLIDELKSKLRHANNELVGLQSQLLDYIIHNV